MSAQNINSLISEFDQEALAAKERLTSVLTMISNGMVPSKEEMTTLDTVVFALQEKYHFICEVTKSLVSADEMPQENSPVCSYADAIEKSQANVLKMHIASAKTILEKFVCVKSLVSTYTEALAPFQADAAAILQQLTTTDTDSIENLSSVTEAPSAFIDALNSDNINAPEGIRLLEKVSQYYPMQVQWGLVGKQYFLDESGVVVNNHHSPDQHDAAPVNDSNENAPFLQLEKHADEIVVDRTSQLADTDSSSSSGKGRIEESITVAADDIDVEAEQLESNNDIILAKNKIKIATPSASAFRKDVISMSRANPSIRAILPLMTNLGALTLDQVFLFGGYMNCYEDNAESKTNVGKALDVLSSKGLLTTYECSEGESALTMYCLSPYCNSCMRKDSIASQMKTFWNVSYGNYIIVGGAEISATCLSAAIENNNLLLKYLYFAKNSTSSSEFSAVTSSIKWDGTNYKVAVVYNNETFTSTLVKPGAHRNDDKNIIVISIDKEYSWDCGGTHDHVFVLNNDVLLLYNSDGTLIEREAVNSTTNKNIEPEQADSDNSEIEKSEPDVQEPLAIESNPIATTPVSEVNSLQSDSPEVKTESVRSTVTIHSLARRTFNLYVTVVIIRFRVLLACRLAERTEKQYCTVWI